MQRPATYAAEGMLSTAHPLATSAGLRILQAGGNAIDAAFAAANVLGVVLPTTSGIGGDSFAIYYDAKSDRTYAINGSGPAPHRLTWETLAERDLDRVPTRGLLSVTVPGAVDVMTTMLALWGSGRFDLAAVLEAAIHYADAGVAVAPNIGMRWGDFRALVARYPSTARVFLDAAGNVPRIGSIHRQPDLAEALRAIARDGRDAFYRGELADAIVAYMARNGGLLTHDDLAAYACEIVEPLTISYRGNIVFTNPPASHGVLLLEILGLIEGSDLCAMGAQSAEAIHTLVEAKKLAYADRNAAFGDPAFVRNPLPRVLDADYLEERRRQIDPSRAIDAPPPGVFPEELGDTTYLCVADRDGNMISLITSISSEFGCADLIDGTGILLNNRGGRGFRAEPGHPNVFGAGKRAMHTLHAYMVQTPDGKRIAGGTPGGDGQPQWNAQVLTNLLDFGLDPQAAIDAPRWTAMPGTDPEFLDRPFELVLEPGFPDETVAQLRARGHRITAADPHRGGSAHLIVRHPSGVLIGANDPRTDGGVAGF